MNNKIKNHCHKEEVSGSRLKIVSCIRWLLFDGSPNSVRLGDYGFMDGHFQGLII